jgi:hypothetical protein
MKTTDKAELIKLARMAADHVPDERDDFFDELNDLLEARETKSRDLVKPRDERE